MRERAAEDERRGVTIVWKTLWLLCFVDPGDGYAGKPLRQMKDENRSGRKGVAQRKNEGNAEN